MIRLETFLILFIKFHLHTFDINKLKMNISVSNPIENTLNYTIYIFYALTIFIFGFFGNIMGTIVLLKKRLKKLGARNIYRYLFITDTIYLIQIVIDCIAVNYGFNITIYSIAWCRIYYHLNNSFATLSPMLLVYISIERFISIKYPHLRFTLRRSHYQLIFLIIIFAFNLVYYLPFLIYFNLDIIESNGLECNFADAKSIKTFTFMDLTNRVLTPCILITMTSILLILTIFKTRNRAFKRSLRNTNLIENRSFKKDIKFTIISISLNLFYIILTIPLPIVSIFSDYFSDFAFYFSFYLFLLTYSINFYVFLIFNSLFRKEFFNLFRTSMKLNLTNRQKVMELSTDNARNL